jgi:hypothetical protein
MSLESYETLTHYERELLWCAQGDCPWLISFRNGIGELPDTPVETFRKLAGQTLIGLAEADLIYAALWRWPDEVVDIRRLSVDELREMLADGTAWDPDQELSVGIVTTEAGDAILTRPDDEPADPESPDA